MISQVPFGIHSSAVYGLAGVMSGRVVALCLLESVRGRSQLDAVWKMIPPLLYVVYMEVKKRS